MDSNISKNSQNRPLLKYSTLLLLSIICLSFLVLPAFAEKSQVNVEESSEMNADTVNNDETEDDHQKAVLNAVVEQLAKNEDEITCNNNEIDDADTVNASDHENDSMDDFDQEVVDSDVEGEDEDESETNTEESVDESLVAEKNRKVVKKKKERSRNIMTEGRAIALKIA